MTNLVHDDMEYRVQPPSAMGFETARDEYLAMREYAQRMLTYTDPNDVVDTLLMLTNVCEWRAIAAGGTPIAPWWSQASDTLRAVIVMLNTPHSRPNVKLENPMLYFPDVEKVS